MLRHVVTDLHEVYLKEFEAQLGKNVTKPQIASKKESDASSEKSDGGGAPDEKIKKQARQLAYDTRYKARREGIPLERAWSQALQNSSASAPVKELAKSMVFGSVNKEEYTLDEEEGSKKQMVLVTPVKGYGKPYRRYATREKIHQLRSNPQIQSVVGTSYGTPYEGEKKKGEQTAAALQHKQPEKKAKKDYDGDGKIESGTDEWKGSRDKAIKKAIAKKPVKEEYFSWRDDLREVLDVLDKEKNEKKISEKKVNNKIIINPPLKETVESLGGQLVEIEELSEDYLNESIDYATDYFFNQGLNEDGLDIVIEELGLEKFTDFVFYIAEDCTLIEARRSGRIEPVTKSGKSIGSLKGGAKASAIRAKQKEKAARDKSNDRPSQMTAALKSQSSVAKKITTDKGKKAVEKAKSTQGSKKPLKDRIAKGVLGAVKAYQQGMERHRQATATAGKALKVAAKGASEFGKGVASGVKATGTAAQKVKKAVVGEAVYGGVKPEPKDKRYTVTAADKKANTKAWQNYKSGDKRYKAADHLQNEEKKMKGEDPCWKGYEMVGTKKKRGKEVPNCVPKEAVNPYAVGMAAAMKSTGDKPPLKKSTITKAHKIAKKVEAKEGYEVVDEAISTVTGQQGSQVAGKQQDTERKQTANAQAKLNKILQARKNLQMAQQQALRSGVSNIGASFEMEGDSIDELNRYEKETGKDYKTGKPVSTGGAKDDKAYTHMKKVIRRMEGTPKGQQKKVPGKKPPAAGQYGAPLSPAQKVKKRREAAQKAQDMMHSRFD